MTLSLQVIYPIKDDTHFDMDYYLSTHDALVQEHMGAHIATTQVCKGLAGGPDTPPPFYAIFTATFTDQAAMDAALAGSGPVLADISNFTNTQPMMLMGEVMT